LWECDDEQWRKIMPCPYERRGVPTDMGKRQLALPVVGLVVSFMGACVA